MGVIAQKVLEGVGGGGGLDKGGAGCDYWCSDVVYMPQGEKIVI